MGFLQMTLHHVKYFNELIRDLTREIVPHGKEVTADDKCVVFRKAEEQLSGTPRLYREFMTARTNRLIVFPKKSGDPT